MLEFEVPSKLFKDSWTYTEIADRVFATQLKEIDGLIVRENMRPTRLLSEEDVAVVTIESPSI